MPLPLQTVNPMQLLGLQPRKRRVKQNALELPMVIVNDRT
jgi:hypothetical protein